MAVTAISGGDDFSVSEIQSLDKTAPLFTSGAQLSFNLLIYTFV